jgi:hypothetical protein
METLIRVEYTKTMPEPQEPDHLSPAKEIQFLWPKWVIPTDIFGLSIQHIRKSRRKVGCGRDKFGYGYNAVLGLGVLLKLSAMQPRNP